MNAIFIVICVFCLSRAIRLDDDRVVTFNVFLFCGRGRLLNEGKKKKSSSVCYHDIAGDVGDLQGQRQHVELTHDLEDQLGVRPRQLQQVEQVRRVTDAQTHFRIHTKTHTFWGPNVRKLKTI